MLAYRVFKQAAGARERSRVIDKQEGRSGMGGMLRKRETRWKGSDLAQVRKEETA